MNFNWITQNLTPEQKAEMWNSIIDGRQLFYERLYDEVKNNKDIFGKLFTLEFNGGECWTCGEHWKEQRNQATNGKYYIPDCECFVTCPNCDTPLYDLQHKYNNKLYFCDNCNMQLINTVTNSKRHGKVFKQYFDGLSIRQKYECVAERFDIK